MPGDRLPPARDLAAVLGVNPNTVLRALRQLRDEGLLEFRRGLGVRVAGTPEHGLLLSKARELLALARHHGYRSDELAQMIERPRAIGLRQVAVRSAITTSAIHVAPNSTGMPFASHQVGDHRGRTDSGTGRRRCARSRWWAARTAPISR